MSRVPGRAAAASSCRDVDAHERRLRAAGMAAGVAHDLVRRYPAKQIADALDVLPARRPADAVGWLVRAVSEAWDLRTEADTIRHTRARALREQARALEAARLEHERGRRLEGWACAVSDALTDQQVAAAVELVARPIGWLGRRSAPLATTQLIVWAIEAASESPQQPLDAVLRYALHASLSTTPALPNHVPTPPNVSTLTTADDLRDRVRRAVTVLERNDLDRQLEQKGGIRHDR